MSAQKPNPIEWPPTKVVYAWQFILLKPEINFDPNIIDYDPNRDGQKFPLRKLPEEVRMPYQNWSKGFFNFLRNEPDILEINPPLGDTVRDVTDANRSFVLGEAVEVMAACGWPRPDWLQQTGNSPSETKQGGVNVWLPHTTKILNAVFKIQRDFWQDFDPNKLAHKQITIARAIDRELGWKEQGNGEPSKAAQTLASAIRPDLLNENDRGAKKHTKKD